MLVVHGLLTSWVYPFLEKPRIYASVICLKNERTTSIAASTSAYNGVFSYLVINPTSDCVHILYHCQL